MVPYFVLWQPQEVCVFFYVFYSFIFLFFPFFFKGKKRNFSEERVLHIKRREEKRGEKQRKKICLLDQK